MKRGERLDHDLRFVCTLGGKKYGKKGI